MQPTSKTQLVLAVACALSVANVYYVQPLLSAIGCSLAIPRSQLGVLVGATQLGSLLALLLVVPLSDCLDRKRMIVVALMALVAACLGAAWAQTRLQLCVGLLALGLLGTTLTQALIAYAATLAPEGARGGIVGTAQGGVVVGLLLARVVAGVISELASWRVVYLASALSALLLIALSRQLPAAPPPVRIPYLSLVRSMGRQLRTNRTLQRRGMLGLLLFAQFNLMWSALAVELSPTQSEAQIGGWGLIGMLGALAARSAGRAVDRGGAGSASRSALLGMVLAWPALAGTPRSLWALGLGVLLLDLGAQALHVLNQSLILASSPHTQGRSIASYMLFYAVGSGIGGLLGPQLHASYGWHGVCGFGVAVALTAFTLIER